MRKYAHYVDVNVHENVIVPTSIVFGVSIIDHVGALSFVCMRMNRFLRNTTKPSVIPVHNDLNVVIDICNFFFLPFILSSRSSSSLHIIVFFCIICRQYEGENLGGGEGDGMW